MPTDEIRTKPLVQRVCRRAAGRTRHVRGNRRTWHRPIRLGDRFTTRTHLRDLIEHRTRFAGRSIQQIYRCEFYREGGELVAEGDSWCFRTERDTAREQGTKYSEVKAKTPVHYSREKLAEIYALYASVPCRCRPSRQRFPDRSSDICLAPTWRMSTPARQGRRIPSNTIEYELIGPIRAFVSEGERLRAGGAPHGASALVLQ
jgi:hypothetical protein